MIKSLCAAALGFVVLLVASSTINAAQPFDAKSFQAAQAADKTILIDIYAPWCPVCRKQQPILESVQKERPSLVIYRVDYDSAKDVLNHLRASRQGTLILFKGRNEVGRLIYDADPGNIRALVAKGF